MLKDLKEETGMIGLVHDGQGVVNVVLERSIEERVMGVRVFEFVTPVKVDAITWN